MQFSNQKSLSMMVKNWSQNEKQGGDKAKNPALGKVLKLNASRD